MTLLLWLVVAVVVIALLFALSACVVSGEISEQERQREDAQRHAHARLRTVAQAIVAASSRGRPGLSTYVPVDLLYMLEDALDDRVTYPESKFDVVGGEAG